MSLVLPLAAGACVAAAVYAAGRAVPATAGEYARRIAARCESVAPLTFFVHPAFLNASLGLVPALLGAALLAAALVGVTWTVVGLVVVVMFASARLTKTEEKLQEALRRQLPDAMEVIATNAAARASIPTALRDAAGATPAPLREVLLDVVKSYDRGIVFPDALRATASRVRSRELNLAFDIVAVCFRQGSQLDEVSRRLSVSLRALHAFRTKIRNETSGARMGMRVMLAMPVLVLIMMSSVEGDAVSMMFERLPGIALFVVAGVLLLLAWLWARSILRSFL